MTIDGLDQWLGLSSWDEVAAVIENGLRNGDGFDPSTEGLALDYYLESFIDTYAGEGVNKKGTVKVVEIGNNPNGFYEFSINFEDATQAFALEDFAGTYNILPGSDFWTDVSTYPIFTNPSMKVRLEGLGTPGANVVPTFEFSVANFPIADVLTLFNELAGDELPPDLINTLDSISDQTTTIGFNQKNEQTNDGKTKTTQGFFIKYAEEIVDFTVDVADIIDQPVGLFTDIDLVDVTDGIIDIDISDTIGLSNLKFEVKKEAVQDGDNSKEVLLEANATDTEIVKLSYKTNGEKSFAIKSTSSHNLNLASTLSNIVNDNAITFLPITLTDTEVKFVNKTATDPKTNLTTANQGINFGGIGHFSGDDPFSLLLTNVLDVDGLHIFTSLKPDKSFSLTSNIDTSLTLIDLTELNIPNLELKATLEGIGINYTSNAPTFNPTGGFQGSLTLENYDPVQNNEPLLFFTGGMQADPTSVTGFFNLDSTGTSVWENPFGIPDSEFSQLYYQRLNTGLL